MANGREVALVQPVMGGTGRRQNSEAAPGTQGSGYYVRRPVGRILQR
jgi:hypothetical protein